jgi:transposase
MRDAAVLGIDISKSKFHVCLLHPNGKTRPKVFANTAEGHQQLLNWLCQLDVHKIHACMEATGSYGLALARFLHAAQQTVSVVNPGRIKGFAQSEMMRTKTDKVDAAVIARFCRALQPEVWSPPAPEVEHLQALMRRLEALMQMKCQEQNRLESLPADTVKASIEAHLHYLDTDITKTKQLIADHFDQHPGLKSKQALLTSIPGIGEQTAAVILAEIGAIEAFSSARQLAAYCGLTPREKLSGTSVRGRPCLSRMGNARLRKALFFPAITATQHNPCLQALWQRLLERGKPKMAIIGAVMRKLLHLVYGVLKSGRLFDPAYKVQAGG